MLLQAGHRAIVVTLLVLCGSRARSSRLNSPMPGPALSGRRARARQASVPDAEQAYETLQKLSPEVAEVHASLGLSYFNSGSSTRRFRPCVRR